MLQSSIRERGKVVIVDLAGRITLGKGDKVLHELVDDLLGAGHRTLVLNLADVEYIDSTGLGELVGALRVTRAMGGRLRIVSPPGRVFDTLSVARLLPLFKVFESEAEVIRSFEQEPDSTAEPQCTLEVIGHVGIVTLNRPRHSNALTRSMLSELVSMLAAVRSDRAIRALVLTGAGQSFCQGADPGELLEGEGALPTLELLQTVIKDVATMPKPVIAAINGAATGAGLDLALAADLRILSESATVASGFLQLGLVPDGGSTYFLPRLVGQTRAAELVLTGRALESDEALRWGLVNRVVARRQVVDEARDWAQELGDGPLAAIGRAKSLLLGNAGRDLGSALAAEAEAQAHALAHEEFREGIHAHLEKREAKFPR